MKSKVSLLSIRNAAVNDMRELSSLNLMICIVMGILPALIFLAYEFFFGSIVSFLMFVDMINAIGLIILATLSGKVALDIVHHRKQILFSHLFSLLQAFLVQVAALELWYGVVALAFKDISYIFDLLLQFHGHGGTEDGIYFFLFVALLYILMRLQFTSLYILEQRCHVVQAIRRSWSFTRRNRVLVERFFLWEIAFVTTWILSIDFIFSLHWNIDFAIMSIAFAMVLATPMQVRMFKELE